MQVRCVCDVCACVDFFVVLDQECASTFLIKEDRKPVFIFIQWFDFCVSLSVDSFFYGQINGSVKHYTSEYEDRRNKIRHKMNWNCIAKRVRIRYYFDICVK